MNTADSDVLLDDAETGAAPGNCLQGLFGIDGTPPDQVLGADGRLTLRLPLRAGWVWMLRGTAPAAASTATTGPAPVAATLDPLPAEPQTGDFTVSGKAGAPFQLVLDGQLASAPTVVPGADGRWQARVDTSAMRHPGLRHALTAWDAAAGLASPAQTFSVQPRWTLLAALDDPAGDDHGPGGSPQRYTYPSDPSFASRPMDIRRVRVFGAGGFLRGEVQMQAISRSWAPPSCFDHVAFRLCIALPGQDGSATVMPLQHGTLPNAMRWHRRLRVHGWSNALFTADGATAGNEGTPLSPAARVNTDPAARTITLSLPAASSGGLSSLSGARLYLSTWDYDGGDRALGAAAG